MNITKNSAVTLSYKVQDATGKMLEKSDTPMVYLHGGYGNTFAKIEEALEGKTTGFSTVLDLSAEDAFGVRDESLMVSIPKTQFPPGVKVGGALQGHDDSGKAQTFTVLKIKGDQVLLDGNHPMAGKALRF